MDSKIVLQPAYVLHLRPYKETSVLADFFTQDYGIIRAVVRGAKRKRNRMPRIKHFTQLLVSWYGSNELKTTMQIDIKTHAYINLSGKKLLTALYINELLLRLLHSSISYTNIYMLYTDLLHNLTTIDKYKALVLIFEKKLLSAIGYGVSLTHDIEQVLLQSDSYYCFVPHHGLKKKFLAHQREDVFYGQDLIDIADDNYHQVQIEQAAEKLFGLEFDSILNNKSINSKLLLNSLK